MNPKQLNQIYAILSHGSDIQTNVKKKLKTPIFYQLFSEHSCIFQPAGNGAMQSFANNNPPPVAPRDTAFGNVGRPNGRSPGNGGPPVTATTPPTATKSSVTISNGRDPRRAKR